VAISAFTAFSVSTASTASLAFALAMIAATLGEESGP
jgi:NhaP-type Na+/H+ or K+/H+ antiporter